MHPTTASTRLQLLDDLAKMEKAYVGVRERIAAEKIEAGAPEAGPPATPPPAPKPPAKK